MSSRRFNMIRHRRQVLTGCAVLAAVLVLAPSVLAANAVNVNVQVPAAFSISGTVKTTGGAAIVGASVFGTSSSDAGFSATNASGAFSLTGLNPGTYKLQVVAPTDANLLDGFFTTANANHFTTASASASGIIVGPSKSGIAIKVPAGFTISGHITTTGGTALAGVTVFGAGSTTFDSRTTDASGNYTLRGLAAGAYTLFLTGSANFLHGVFTTANANHFSTTAASASTVSVGPNKTGVNARIPTGFSISGKITNPSGTPLAGVAVPANSATGYRGFASTDVNGNYTIQGLAAGTYKIGMSDFGSNFIAGFFTTANANHFTTSAAAASGVVVGPNRTGISSKMSAGFSISGKITTTGGAPLANVNVSTDSSSPSVVSSSTDAMGNYKLIGLKSGNYKLNVEAAFQTNFQTGHFSTANANHFVVTLAGATAISVGPSKTGINIMTPTGLTISGKVTKAGGVAPSFTSVIASNANGSFGTFTAADGTYKIIGLSPGTYKVAVSPTEADLQSGFFTAANTAHFTGSSASATGVTVGP
jgi:protocatechuate 3,4-dioxygenase beta subunit